MTVATTVDSRAKAGERHPTAKSQRALALPLLFAAALGALGLVPSINGNLRLLSSVLGAAAVLMLATAVLRTRVGARRLSYEIVLRPQHYLQACAQGTVLAYWGWYWRPVYEAAPLIAAQLLFAYAFDMLLAWWRRDDYTLGFAPFPVIFSINLFLWFKADWFYLQFLMIGVGFAAKELMRWNKGGRRVHIFNPSSFPLAVFSLALLATGTTSWTWGPEIARTQFNPPNIYLLLFLIGLPGQFLFGVTTMTMAAVVTTYLFGALYFAVTGAYFFVDSYIPIAVFLGMHLLFTDPSTSPRTELGRIMFGIAYGLGNILLYEVLGNFGLPTFYDKLLPVPLLNVSIKLIDRMAQSPWLKRLDPAQLGRSLSQRRRNLAYIGVWSTVFAVMASTDAVGDHHPGHKVPFWQQACLQDARHACETLAVILDTYCSDGSGWACNEIGVLRWHGRANGIEHIADDFLRGCQRGFTVSCQNTVGLQIKGPPQQGRPQLVDYPVILRTGKGALPDKTPLELYTRACDQGWMAGCESVGGTFLKGDGVTRDPARAATALEKACSGGLATACSNLGLMHYSADGLPRDQEKGLRYLQKACEMGYGNACRWLKDVKP